MADELTRELSFEELEAVHAESYSEVFDESTFMDECELEVLLTKEEKEAQARWACGSSSATRCATSPPSVPRGRPCIWVSLRASPRRFPGLKFSGHKCEGACPSSHAQIPPTGPFAPQNEPCSTVNRSNHALWSAFSGTSEADTPPGSQSSS